MLTVFPFILGTKTFGESMDTYAWPLCIGRTWLTEGGWVSPGGGTQIFLPTTNAKPLEKSNGIHRKKVKVAGRIVNQPKRPKIDVISMRQAAKRANKTDLPMFLCLMRPTKLPQQKNVKSKAKVGVAKGQTEGEKRW